MPTALSDIQVVKETTCSAPLLEERFAILKRSLVQPQHRQRVIESYERLVKALETEVARIEKHGSSLVPEIDFAEVRENCGELPSGFVDIVRDRGCVILRNVVSEELASSWEASLKDYVHKHPGVGGFPIYRPAAWSVYWTKAQVEMRSHPAVLEAMRSVSQLWHVNDPALPIDLTRQVVYPDRVRIRYPSDDPGQFPLAPHLDSGSIERWEDEEYRKNYAAIFEGDWENWDGWAADHRINASMDLYETGISCSTWRSLQGWMSLSHTNTGEGTLRLLPSLKASVAYLMLKPLFPNGVFNDELPVFPGSSPGKTQFMPTDENHPHLAMQRSIVGIPPVRPGDYVFWHCDLVHSVDPTNPGINDSSVSYNACNPLVPYNIKSLLPTRAAFLTGDVPADFVRSHKDNEREYQHEDCGAKEANILSDEGLQAMGLQRFEDQEQGLTEGQRKVRILANAELGL